MGNKYIIGIDFGTLSARAVVVARKDGQVLGEHVVKYPHGVVTGALPDGTAIPEDYALAVAEDYRDALYESIKGAIADSGVNKDDIVSIGIDATTYSMVPCLADGMAVCELSEYRSHAMAYIKLWKHQGASKQAAAIEKAYRQDGRFPVLDRYGGVCNCEFAVPKLLETYEKDRAVFEKVYRFCDLGEWLAWLLTGKSMCSRYSASYKAMWAEDLGWPKREDLDSLSDGFAEGFYSKFAATIRDLDALWGSLSEETAEKLGLRAGISVSTPMGDGSIPGLYFCVNDPSAAVVSLGTSIGIAFTTDKKHAINGINGVTFGGIVPGRWSYDAGTPCAGDMLDWMCRCIVPKSVTDEAEKNGMDLHSYLSSQAAAEPWKNSLTVLDWWNGNRSIINDMSLRGSILGISLSTAPADIYCAFLQSIACSLRVIFEHFENNGIKFGKIVLCGGIPQKNRFLVSQIAEILGRSVYISKEKQLTAVSSAILGAMAAGDEMTTAARDMARQDFIPVTPELTHKAEYDEIFRRFRHYHDLLSE